MAQPTITMNKEDSKKPSSIGQGISATRRIPLTTVEWLTAIQANYPDKPQLLTHTFMWDYGRLHLCPSGSKELPSHIAARA